MKTEYPQRAAAGSFRERAYGRLRGLLPRSGCPLHAAPCSAASRVRSALTGAVRALAAALLLGALLAGCTKESSESDPSDSGDMGMGSWPYVVNGNTIVFADSEGAMPGAEFHDNWKSDKVTCAWWDVKTVSRKLRIAKANTFSNVSWERAASHCRDYYEEDKTEQGSWRLPTLGEIEWIYKLTGLLTDIENPWTWGGRQYYWLITDDGWYARHMYAYYVKGHSSAAQAWGNENPHCNTRCVSDLP